MTIQPLHGRRVIGDLGVGTGGGVVLGLVSSLVPIATILAVGVLMIGTWMAALRRRPASAVIGGATIGASLVFLWGVLNTVEACSETANFCGDTNVMPLFAFAVLGFATGRVGSVASLRAAPK